MFVWVAPMQLTSNMVYALERQLQPNLVFGRHLVSRQHLQSSSLQSVCHHMAHSSMPVAISAQQRKWGIAQHAAKQGLGMASEMLRPHMQAGVKLPEKGHQQQQQQSSLQQSRLE